MDWCVVVLFIAYFDESLLRVDEVINDETFYT
jgi:hypothetical protein